MQGGLRRTSRPLILLIAGMGSSMNWWEDGFCARLADGGRYEATDSGGYWWANTDS